MAKKLAEVVSKVQRHTALGSCNIDQCDRALPSNPMSLCEFVVGMFRVGIRALPICLPCGTIRIRKSGHPLRWQWACSQCNRAEATEAAEVPELPAPHDEGNDEECMVVIRPLCKERFGDDSISVSSLRFKTWPKLFGQGAVRELVRPEA